MTGLQRHPESSVPVVERFWAANAAGDVEGLKAVLSPDVEWTVVGHTVPIARTYHGWDGFFGELIATLMTLFVPGSVVFDIQEIYEDVGRSTVVTYFHETATSVTGASFRNDIVTIMKIEDGQIVRAREVMDLYEVKTATEAPA